MRTVSNDLRDSIIASSSTLAHVWRITRQDGTVVRLTDAVLDFKLGTEIFHAAVGFTPTAVYQSAINQAGQSLQLVTAMTPTGITRDDLLVGKYADADAELSVVDYKDGSAGELKLFVGRFGRPKWTNRDVLTIEVLPTTSVAQIIGGDKYGDLCRNMFGDPDTCTVVIENFKTDFTVTATGGVLDFTVDSISNQADGYYTLGHIVWDTGDNEGVTSDVRISKADGSVSLFYRTQLPVAIGDTGRIYPGCDLQHNTCKVKYDKLNFFRGEPFRPTWVFVKGLPNGGGPGNVTGGTLPNMPRYGDTRRGGPGGSGTPF